MIKSILKVRVSTAPMSPKLGRIVTPRSYNTEVDEYVPNTSVGMSNVAGVDPSVVGERSICSAILKDMHGDIALVDTGNEGRAVGKLWLTPLVIDNDEHGSSHF